MKAQRKSGRTRFQLRVKLNVCEDGQPSTSSASNVTKKSKSQSWRDRLKESDPGRYKLLKEKARKYARLYRLQCATATVRLKRNATDEEREEALLWQQRKKQYNESARKRMKRMNERKKAEAVHNKKLKKPQTRNHHEKIKEKERLKKRQQRASMSQQRKEEILAKRRERYHQQKAKEREKQLQDEKMRLEKLSDNLKSKELEIDERNKALPVQDTLDLRTQNAKSKALERARKSLPKARSHCINTSIDLIAKASPAKTAAFERAGLHAKTTTDLDKAIVQAVSEGLSELPKHSIKRRSLASSLTGIKKGKLQRAACRKFGVSRKLLANAVKRAAGRKPTPMATIMKVTELYESNLRILPDKKLVSKKTCKPAHILESSVTDLHAQYISENPDHQVGSATFHRLRPKHVKVKSQAKYVGCLCEYCENLNLKISVINHQQPGTFNGLYDLSHSTMCAKSTDSKFHDPSCIHRECSECGVDKIDERLKNLDLTRQQEWKHWEMMETKCHTNKETKTVKKRGLVTKCGTLEEMMKELKEELKPFSKHLFTKDWQHGQQCYLQKHLKEDEVSSVFDFAENFNCYCQREVQSAHYTQESATVHPVVTYYLCTECKEPVTESCIMVSNDLHHDYNLVNRFQEVVTEHLISHRKIPIKTFYRFSDGCCSQYKSKGPISDVSYGRKDFGITIHHNFSGTRHGKGASDGESGVVKRKAAEAIKAGAAVINNAKSLYEYLTANMTRESEEGRCCTAFRRTMFYVPVESVSRDRMDRVVRTVTGIRKLHSIKGLQAGVIATRNLSCFCDGCERGSGSCCNTKYVEPWKLVQLDCKAAATAGPVGLNSPDDETADDDMVPVGDGAGDDDSTESTDKENADSINKVKSGSKPPKLNINSYVAVKFESAKKPHLRIAYLALVTAVYGGAKCQVKFLRRTPKELFEFSSEPEALHPAEDVITQVREPTMVMSGRSCVYQFDPEDIASLSKDYILKSKRNKSNMFYGA